MSSEPSGSDPSVVDPSVADRAERWASTMAAHGIADALEVDVRVAHNRFVDG